MLPERATLLLEEQWPKEVVCHVAGLEASPKKHYHKPATGVVCTRVFLRLFFVAVCPQHLPKGEVSAGQVCLHCMFTCKFASGIDCSWKQEERETEKDRKVEIIES